MAKIVISSEDVARVSPTRAAPVTPPPSPLPNHAPSGSPPRSVSKPVVLVGLGGALVVVMIAIVGWLSIQHDPGSGSHNSPTADGDAEKTKQAILVVLNADKRLADTMRSETANLTPSQLAERIGNYCNQAEALDLTACPADFRLAYRQHFRAWREVRAAIQELPDSPFDELFMMGFNRLVDGQPTGGSKELRDNVKQALTRLRTTWEEVERIGMKYGAAI